MTFLRGNGHVVRLLPVARALADRAHDAALSCQRAMLDVAEGVGLRRPTAVVRAGRLVDVATRWTLQVVVHDEVYLGAIVAVESLGLPPITLRTAPHVVAAGPGRFGLGFGGQIRRESVVIVRGGPSLGARGSPW